MKSFDAYDSGGRCWDRGQSFESLAVSILNREGIPTRASSAEQDYKEHTDFFAYSVNWSRWVSVDAKAMKRINRSDPSVQDDTTYVEWLNTAGYDGWMVKGADVIIFERKDSILIISREDLLSFCEEKINKDLRVDSARECLYKVYSRQGRSDLISMIRLDDLPKDKIKIYLK